MCHGLLELQLKKEFLEQHVSITTLIDYFSLCHWFYGSMLINFQDIRQLFVLLYYLLYMYDRKVNRLIQKEDGEEDENKDKQPKFRSKLIRKLQQILGNKFYNYGSNSMKLNYRRRRQTTKTKQTNWISGNSQKRWKGS